jgi:hypothetical protein
VLDSATDFEIRCWPDEMNAFEIGEQYGERVKNTAIFYYIICECSPRPRQSLRSRARPSLLREGKVTTISFGLALMAVPISGANAPGGGLPYPYLDTLKQFPKDYLWMFTAIILILTYVVVMTSIHLKADIDRKVFSQIGLIFTIISAVILLTDYFIQIAVVPVSLMNNETAGMTLITQYNPHGFNFDKGLFPFDVSKVIGFYQQLKEHYQKSPGNIRLIIYPDTQHEFTEEMWDESIRWLQAKL